MTDTDIIVKIDQDKAAKLDKINAEKRDPIEKALAAGWVYYDEKNRCTFDRKNLSSSWTSS